MLVQVYKQRVREQKTLIAKAETDKRAPSVAHICHAPTSGRRKLRHSIAGGRISPTCPSNLRRGSSRGNRDVEQRSVKAAFEKQIVLLPLDIIVPQKEVTQGHRSGEFYKQLTASLKHVGVIEPLVVYPRGPGDYLLLDGHVRLEILKSIGMKEAKCLLSTDDEAYTYNRHVNHIPAIAQHFMLLEALKTGLTEERIAAALDVSLDSIRPKRDLLNGICPEAVQILADKHSAPRFSGSCAK